MKTTDHRHPNNDCKVWSQLHRWQAECIRQIKQDTGRTESEIVRKLLEKPLNDYLEKIKNASESVMS